MSPNYELPKNLGVKDEFTLDDSPILPDYGTELGQLDVSANGAHSVSDHRSGSADRSSPPLYFPSSDDNNIDFYQRHTPPPSSSPPLYFHSSDDHNAALSDDDCTSVLSLALNTDTGSSKVSSSRVYSVGGVLQPPSAAEDDAFADVAYADSVPGALKTNCDSS